MPKIIISAEAMASLQRSTPNGVGTKDCALISRGRWHVPIGQEALAGLRGVKLKGESLSDAIIRITSVQKGYN